MGRHLLYTETFESVRFTQGVPFLSFHPSNSVVRILARHARCAQFDSAEGYHMSNLEGKPKCVGCHNTSPKKAHDCTNNKAKGLQCNCCDKCMKSCKKVSSFWSK